MSLIGTLEQFNLSRLLERIETYNKTGLLVIKQGAQWIELYFRAGRLMCTGPAHGEVTLGERLLEDGVISPHALQETLKALGAEQRSETRIALMLMDMGFVGQEDLRLWATRKATQMLQMLLTWSKGEVYFEEEVLPPQDRLLVALSVSSLLASLAPLPASAPPAPGAAAPAVPAPHQPAVPPSTVPTTDVSKLPTLMDPAQFFEETSSHDSGFFATEDLVPLFDSASEGAFDASSAPAQPQAAPTTILPPQYVDPSLMRADMVLMPADYSAIRTQNIEFQLTPDHWLLLTRVDGRTSLLAVSQEFSMHPGHVCQVAAELYAMGIIQLAVGGQLVSPKVIPSAGGQVHPGLNSSYLAQANMATPISPYPAAMPSSDVELQFSLNSLATQSQWGNGGNGATFIPGRGWIATPQPQQPLQSRGPLMSGSGVYAQVGHSR